MKKFMVIIMMFFCLFTDVLAVEKATDTITKLENAVLGVTYTDQKTESRLNRLEEYVYGVKKKGTTTERLKHLAKDLNSDVIGQEIEPCEDTLAQQEYESDSSVDYPVIDAVEKNLNIKSNPSQSLRSRLVAIEKQLFSNVYDTDDFYTRVERIKGEVYKNSPAIAYDDEDDEFSIPEYIDKDISDDWGLDELMKRRRNNGNINNNNSRISKLERKILNQTFTDENANDRLARLENAVFDTEFYYDDETERLNRLEGAIRGQKTADRYDNNKFQQRLNTALQIGAMILMVLACIL